MLGFVGVLLVAYLAGSVNFAIILSRLTGREDPRTKFSGNAGTTNVYRQAGKGLAALVLILDIGRAVALMLVLLHFLPFEHFSWIGLGLIMGNRFPCFHRFRGGKGVASYLGLALPITPMGTLLSCIVWVLVYTIVRIPFIASFFMILTLGGAVVAVSDADAISIIGTVVTVLFLFINHSKNIVTFVGERHKKKSQVSMPGSP
jgi:glycerol-3-phosphate acyltransferase PlsY